MKRRSSRRRNEENALDLTPMMDIVFIMLIFFIVTTSFVKETGVDINRPNAETAERDEKGNILVAITENNEIWIKNMHVSEYKHNSDKEYDPIRKRKLLLNRSEIEKINKISTIKGNSIIPVKIFTNTKGIIKLEISLAKGKNIHDKRENIKNKDIKRDTEIDLKKRAL